MGVRGTVRGIHKYIYTFWRKMKQRIRADKGGCLELHTS